MINRQTYTHRDKGHRNRYRDKYADMERKTDTETESVRDRNCSRNKVMKTGLCGWIRVWRAGKLISVLILSIIMYVFTSHFILFSLLRYNYSTCCLNFHFYLSLVYLTLFFIFCHFILPFSLFHFHYSMIFRI